MSPRPEEGSAVVELVWLTVLLLVPFVYVFVAVFDTQRAAYAVSSASQVAARAYLDAPDPESALDRARSAARLALGDHDVEADVDVTCLPTPDACLQPGSSVRVRVHTVQPLPLVPTVLGGHPAGIAVESAHVEPYGSYRAAR
ncbi:MAG: hypothetical protein EON52_05405 [Actinomycetales bacterium]|nr:MAG: hypothetical protein EON52_05405 [Actinomycetales bacterium]